MYVVCIIIVLVHFHGWIAQRLNNKLSATNRCNDKYVKWFLCVILNSFGKQNQTISKKCTALVDSNLRSSLMELLIQTFLQVKYPNFQEHQFCVLWWCQANNCNNSKRKSIELTCSFFHHVYADTHFNKQNSDQNRRIPFTICVILKIIFIYLQNITFEVIKIFSMISSRQNRVFLGLVWPHFLFIFSRFLLHQCFAAFLLHFSFLLYLSVLKICRRNAIAMQSTNNIEH